MKQGGTLIFTRNLDPAKIQDESKLEDFVIKQMLGKGAFGKVFLVQNSKTGLFYAMKAIRKDVVLEQDFFDSLKLEKDILYSVDHPFIVSMDYVYQNDFRIYFLMKFIKGGELYRHLSKQKRFSEE